MDDNILINDHIVNHQFKESDHVLWSHKPFDYEVQLLHNDDSKYWKGEFKTVHKDETEKKYQNENQNYADAIQTLYDESEKVANMFIKSPDSGYKNAKNKVIHAIPKQQIPIFIPIIASIITIIGIYVIFKYHI